MNAEITTFDTPAACSDGGPKSYKPDPFRYDRGAAEFWAHLNNQGLCPLFDGQTFYLYNGRRYCIENHLPQLLRSFLKQHKKPQANNIIGNVVPIVENLAFHPFERRQERCLPLYVGNESFPSPEKIIAFKNGLLDLDTYLGGTPKLLPHTPKWLSTICLPYDFDAEATCPLWRAFLDQVFESDPQRLALYQEWCGYLLMHDVSQHKLMFKVGPPRAGKGTATSIEAALVGIENSTGFNLHSLAERFGAFQLKGKLVAFVGEVNLANSREKYRILEVLNSIVGGDPISIEVKHQSICESLVLPTRFSISCNQLPAFVDPSGALSARLLILNFDKSFEGQEDRDLGRKLFGEIAGIANWALAGYRRLKANGRFTAAESSETLVAEFRRDNSDVLGFVQDCLLVEKRLNPGNLAGVRLVDRELKVDSKDLQEEYAEWCIGHGKTPNPSWLARNLKTIMPKLEHRRNGGGYGLTFFGIALDYVRKRQHSTSDRGNGQPTQAEIMQVINASHRYTN